MNVLFATRAFQSPATEGGFVVLRDLALASRADKSVSGSFFSIKKATQETGPGINLVQAYYRAGWGKLQAIQFVLTLAKQAREYDIVHTAHVPTRTNSLVFEYLKKNAGNSTRFVQTVTALPEKLANPRTLLWGDVIVCLNSRVARQLDSHHHDVRCIPPFPLAERLDSAPPLPAALRNATRNRQVVTMPVVLNRISPEFPAREIISELLEQHSNIHIVFACRFGHEKQVTDWLPEDPEKRKRTSVFGEIEWFPSLVGQSDVVVYPIDNLKGKFNPPMVVTEALSFGKTVVASEGVALGDFPSSAFLVGRKSPAAEWVSSILQALIPNGKKDIFDHSNQCWMPYREIYFELAGNRQR